MKQLILLIFFTSCSLFAGGNRPLPTVSYVELDKYLGKWYEIARFDQSFQKGCTATEANYSLRPDGDIKVINKCRLGSPQGKLKVAEGRAWIVDLTTNAKLKVQFFLSRFRIPFFAGNYWILDLDSDYQYVLVGDKSRNYLWILSRSKQLDSKIFEDLKARAEELGFDTSKLLITEHDIE